MEACKLAHSARKGTMILCCGHRSGRAGQPHTRLGLSGLSQQQQESLSKEVLQAPSLLDETKHLPASIRFWSMARAATKKVHM